MSQGSVNRSGNGRGLHPRSLAALQPGGVPAAPTGNQRRVTHGAFRRLLDDADVDAAERRVFAALAQDAPVRDAAGDLPAADAPAVHQLACVLVRLDGVRDFIRRRGIEDSSGNLRVTELDIERRLRLEAADHGAALGMSPRSRAALGLDLARAQSFDLAAHWSAGDTIDAEDGGDDG